MHPQIRTVIQHVSLDGEQYMTTITTTKEGQGTKDKNNYIIAHRTF